MKKKSILIGIFVFVCLLLVLAIVGSLVVFDLEAKDKVKQAEIDKTKDPNLKFNEMTEYEILVDNETLNSYKTTHLEIDESMDVNLTVEFSMLNNNVVSNNEIFVEAFIYDYKPIYSEDYVIVTCETNDNSSLVPGLFVTEVNGEKQYRLGEEDDILGVPAETYLKVYRKEIDEKTYKYKFAGEYNAEYKINAACMSSKMSCKKISKAYEDQIIVKVENSLKGNLPEIFY